MTAYKYSCACISVPVHHITTGHRDFISLSRNVKTFTCRSLSSVSKKEAHKKAHNNAELLWKCATFSNCVRILTNENIEGFEKFWKEREWHIIMQSR